MSRWPVKSRDQAPKRDEQRLQLHGARVVRSRVPHSQSFDVAGSSFVEAGHQVRNVGIRQTATVEVAEKQIFIQQLQVASDMGKRKTK